MRSLDRLTISGLLLTGIGLCVGNLWYAAARSTIPIAVHGTVTKKQVGIEKHSGVDDVYLITLNDAQVIRVDAPLFQTISQGDELSKAAWQQQLNRTVTAIPLTLSRDFHGLVWCMIAAMATMFLMIIGPRKVAMTRNSSG